MPYMSTAKKITTILPTDLLKEAQAVSGEGITKTIKMALKLLARQLAYKKLASFKGKYKSKMNLKMMRDDV
jgi:hypothetical protein